MFSIEKTSNGWKVVEEGKVLCTTPTRDDAEKIALKLNMRAAISTNVTVVKKSIITGRLDATS